MSQIELLERYVSNASEIEELKNIGVPIKNQTIYKYRRINTRIDDIERIIEIKDSEDECLVRFYGGQIICVKANFDELCIRFNDLCNSNLEE